MAVKQFIEGQRCGRVDSLDVVIDFVAVLYCLWRRNFYNTSSRSEVLTLQEDMLKITLVDIN